MGRLNVWPPGLTLALLAAGAAHAQEPVAAPAMQVGDAWVFERTHEQGATRSSTRRVELRVERVDDESMVIGVRPERSPNAYEDHIRGLDWSGSRIIEGRSVVVAEPFRFPLIPGETWTNEWRDPAPRGAQSGAHWRQVYKVVGWTDVETPAGTFHALEIRMTGAAEAIVSLSAMAAAPARASRSRSETAARTRRAVQTPIHNTLYSAFYYVPKIRYYVKSVQEQYNADGVRTGRDTEVLASFKPAS